MIRVSIAELPVRIGYLPKGKHDLSNASAVLALLRFFRSARKSKWKYKLLFNLLQIFVWLFRLIYCLAMQIDNKFLHALNILHTFYFMVRAWCALRLRKYVNGIHFAADDRPNSCLRNIFSGFLKQNSFATPYLPLFELKVSLLVDTSFLRCFEMVRLDLSNSAHKIAPLYMWFTFIQRENSTKFEKNIFFFSKYQLLWILKYWILQHITVDITAIAISR